MIRFACRLSLICAAVVCSVQVSVSIQADDRAAVSAEWTGTARNPVFSGRADQWDARIRERGWIMKDGPVWKLWYTGYNTEQQPLTMKLGYATSPDGVTWKRWSDDPVFEDSWVEDMMVVKLDGRYLMFAEGAGDQPQMLESEDGIAWTRTGPLDIRQTSGQPIKPGPCGTPTVYVEDNVWHLFYERMDAGIWLAISSDRRVWTNVSDDPLIVPGPAEYDARMIAMNQVVRIGDRYLAVLHGTGTPQKPRQWCTYFAESADLRHWTKTAQGPVLPVAANKSSGVLVHDGEDWRLYTMHAQIDVWFPRD